MKRIGLVALAGAALLALVYSAPAQQTLMGVCQGAVDIVAQSTGLAVNCTPSTTPPAPTVTIAANPTAINPGQSSALTWASTNATACAASGAWNGSESLSGTQSVSPAASATYTLTCTGAGGSANASATVTVATAPPPPGTCSLASPAFCETFNEGPVANTGRGGDLDPAKWTAARISGEINQAPWGGLNPQLQAPIPACRATFTGTIVYSPQDTLVCDPSGTKTQQLMTAVGMQNYGVNSYMILQPFDFAGRTGKIDFDVDAVSNMLGGYPEIYVTDQPVPAPNFREIENYEVGPTPQNGIIVKFGGQCGVATSAAPYNVMVYNNYVGTILTPTTDWNTTGCVQTSVGQLNHFEIQLSQTQISVYGSDFSPDNGATFPNYKLLYQASISLPFSRGYVHVDARNHATLKYTSAPDAVFHWDNIGFDGPVIAPLASYEIPDNNTVSEFTGDAGDPATPAINLGYQLFDGTTGQPAGMYNPTTLILTLSFKNVNLANVTSANLTLNMWFNAVAGFPSNTPSTSWGISYSLNGAAPVTVNLTAAEIAAMSNNTGGLQGFWTPVINVPLSALVNGTNTVAFLPVNAPMNGPPVVTNIDLLLTTSGSPPSAPTVTLGANPTAITAGQSSTLSWSSTNATACVPSGSWSGSEPLSGTQSVSPAVTSTYTLTCNGAGGSAQASVTVSVSPLASGSCNMQLGGTPIFCEPFDVVNSGAVPSRTGGLDPNVWGVSRLSGLINFGSPQSNLWGTIDLIGCNGTTTTLLDPNDVQVCNGQFREGLNDNLTGQFDGGNVVALAAYPKQPFDFAGRTGTVSFDISNDSAGIHAAWPEFWMSDLPVPVPLEFNGSWLSVPQNGFGLRFSNVAPAGDGGECPNTNNLSFQRWTLTDAIVSRNYVYEDTVAQSGFFVGTESNPPLTLTINDCVTAPTEGSGVMNHVEIQVTPSVITVYATDAGVAPSPTTLRKIATVTNANLTFTRGLVWLEDVHYNADKQTLMNGTPQSTSQAQHTFVWDNLAFDGPFPGRDFTFDALDTLSPDTTQGYIAGTVGLGQAVDANQMTSWTIPNVPANPQAANAHILFDFGHYIPPTVINVTVNGHAHSVPWPYPDQSQLAWRTLAVAIPLTDLVAGTNVVQIGTDNLTVVANVDIQLGGVSGAVPVLPGNSRAYPSP